MGRAPPARGQDRTFRPALGVIALHPVARARHPQRSHSCCLIEWITDLDGRKGTAERINQLIVAITWYDNARKRGTDLPAHYRSHHRKVLGGLPDIIIVQHHGEIGRESCRESVCQYVSISVVAVSLKKKTTP